MSFSTPFNAVNVPALTAPSRHSPRFAGDSDAEKKPDAAPALSEEELKPPTKATAPPKRAAATVDPLASETEDRFSSRPARKKRPAQATDPTARVLRADVRKTAAPPRKVEPPRNETGRMLASLMLTAGIPLASALTWMGGPVPGVLIGAPIAYVSGLIGRRVSHGIDTRKVNERLVVVDELVRALQSPKALEPGELSMRLTRVFGRGNGMVNFLLRNVTSFQNMDRLGGATMAGTRTFRIFDRICKGLAVNMSIAREDNVFKAIFAGIKGYLSVLFAWITAPIDVARMVFSHNSQRAG